jgi:cobalt/nickel transport system ATP-binding protein
MTHCAVDMQDVQYRYPDGSVALDGINLQVGRRERAVVLGANGAGKSTLLAVMCGVLQPSRGTIKILETKLTRKTARRLRASIGLAFQEPDNQLFMPTLWEDVAFGPLNMGLAAREVESRVEEALEVVGLTDLRDRPPHHLSVGEKKRAAIATVLAMHPKILVLDEPTAHLDPKSRVDFIAFLAKLHAKGDLTLITATHDVESVPLFADRAYVLSQGRVVAAGTVSEVFANSDLLAQAHLAPPILTQLFQEIPLIGTRFPDEPLPLTIRDAARVLRRLQFSGIACTHQRSSPAHNAKAQSGQILKCCPARPPQEVTSVVKKRPSIAQS